MGQVYCPVAKRRWLQEIRLSAMKVGGLPDGQLAGHGVRDGPSHDRHTAMAAGPLPRPPDLPRPRTHRTATAGRQLLAEILARLPALPHQPDHRPTAQHPPEPANPARTTQACSMTRHRKTARKMNNIHRRSSRQVTLGFGSEERGLSARLTTGADQARHGRPSRVDTATI